MFLIAVMTIITVAVTSCSKGDNGNNGKAELTGEWKFTKLFVTGYSDLPEEMQESYDEVESVLNRLWVGEDHLVFEAPNGNYKSDYTLDASGKVITLVSPIAEGIFYGTLTVKQLTSTKFVMEEDLTDIFNEELSKMGEDTIEKFVLTYTLERQGDYDGNYEALTKE